jgi:hypothetical protein
MADSEDSKTKVTVAYIGAIGVVLAALIGTVGKLSCDSRNAQANDQGSSKVEKASSQNQNLVATTLFRPSDPYPRMLGDLRLGMTYDDVRHIVIKNKLKCSMNLSEIKYDTGPFTGAKLIFSVSDTPTVSGMSFAFRDTPSMAEVIKQAKQSLGAARATPDGMEWVDLPTARATIESGVGFIINGKKH